MKPRGLTGVFITKIIFAMGIVAGLVVVPAKARAGCDGPVLVHGGAIVSCGGCVTTVPHCSGTTTFYDDYYVCGGSGYDSCDTAPNMTIGKYAVPCIAQTDVGCVGTLWTAYNDCLIDAAHGNVPYSSCHNPNDADQYCICTSCVTSTSGGSPLTGTAMSGLGEYTGCTLAKLQKSPSPSVSELVLVILREHGI
jgi:hypothetical protein